MFVPIINKQFSHVVSVEKQIWFVYRMYNKCGQLVCFMGEPAGNSRCRICGQTEENLLDNIKKYVSNKNSMKQHNR